MKWKKKKHVQNWEQLRKQRMLARDALVHAGKLEFKRYSSAKWADFIEESDGSRVAMVQHDDVEECTPEMIQWFFEHLACCITWNGIDFSGPKVSVYHLWHHRDHVTVTPMTDAGEKKNLGFLLNAETRIHELTNEINKVIYYRMKTICLDTHEFTFQILVNNKPAGMSNTFMNRQIMAALFMWKPR